MTGSGGDGGKCSGSGESALGEPFGPPGKGPSKDWGCGVGQGMTGRVFDRLGIKDGMGFAPGGDWGRGVEPKRRRDGDRPVRGS